MASSRLCARLLVLGALFACLSSCDVAGRSALNAQQATGGDPEVSARRVLDLASTGMGRWVMPTPDGRSILFELWNQADTTGDVGIRDLATGAIRRVTTQKVPDQQTEHAMMSPDGRWIAYRQFMSDPDDEYELRVIRPDGTGQRTLLVMGRPAEAIEWADHHAWSPDGRTLLVIQWLADRTIQMVLIPVDGSPQQVLKSLDWAEPGWAAFSPDGRSILYDLPEDQNSRVRQLHVIAVDGSREVRITDDPTIKRVIGWSSDGSGVYYSVQSSEHNTRITSVWRLPMQGERPAGAPELVRGDLNAAAGFQLAGDRIFYVIHSRTQSLWSIGVDLAAGRVTVPPAQYITEHIGPPANHFWGPEQLKWTPDGRCLTYFRRSTRGWLWQKELELVLRGADSDDVRTIPVPLNTLTWQYQWDSNTILASGQLRGSEPQLPGQPQLLKIDLATGQSSPYHDAELENSARASLGPGGAGGPATMVVTFSPDRRVKYFRRESAGGFELVARDLSTGSDRVLYRAPQNNFFGFEPSPDGRYIVFTVRQAEIGDELRVVPTSGEASWVAYQAPAGRIIGGGSFNWSPDSRTIVFAENSQTPPAAVTYWKVAVDGTGAKALFSGPPAPGAPHLHPDGKRIVFSSGFSKPVTELWVLENLVETRSSARR